MELHQVMLVAPYFWVGCLFRLFRDQLTFTLNRAVGALMLLGVIPLGNLL